MNEYQLGPVALSGPNGHIVETGEKIRVCKIIETSPTGLEMAIDSDILIAPTLHLFAIDAVLSHSHAVAKKYWCCAL